MFLLHYYNAIFLVCKLLFVMTHFLLLAIFVFINKKHAGVEALTKHAISA